MRIGIISMQRIENYGSLLQAYALKKVLEGRGHSVTFVDIVIKAGYQYPKTRKLKRLIIRLKKVDRYILRRLGDSKKNKAMSEMFRREQAKKLGLTDGFMTEEGCDAIVIGSDEIFNCSSKSRWGVDAKRFGDIPSAKKVISYAASCGYTNLEDIADSEDFEAVKKGLQNLDAISVRDQNTASFVQAVCAREPVFNLDPVLIYDFTWEIESVPQEKIPSYPYMIVYSYHNRIDSEEEIRAIRKFAKKKGLKTIAIGGALPWCDEFRILTPFQVLAFFKNAFYIVTDTFHGTIFSVKLNKKFAVIVRDSNANKLNDLIYRLDVENHKLTDMNCLEKVLEETSDYSDSNATIKKEIYHAYEYLRDTGL